MDLSEERKRITNRHIAVLLSRIKETKVEFPQIIQDEIKRYMWFLSENLKKMYEDGIVYKEGNDGQSK